MKDDTASSTARLIARAILLASRDSHLKKLVAPNEAELSETILQRSRGNKAIGIALSRIPTPILLKIEGYLVPGLVTHFLLRKRKIEATVRKALAQGDQAVVVIAAGFDTLCLRLHHEFADADFIEIDHPATQKPKQGISPKSSNLHFIPADLIKKSIAEVLSSSSLRLDTRSIFVVEGLTMYLKEDDVLEIFKQIAPYCGKLVFTFMEEDQDGDIGFRDQSHFTETWLEALQEPFLWGITRAKLPQFLAKSGLKVQEIIGEPKLRAEFLAPLNLNHLPLAKGECLCIAAPSP